MIRTDYDISDKDFEKINQPFMEDITKYVRDNFIFDYLAYYIATGYRKDALWAGNLVDCSMVLLMNYAAYNLVQLRILNDLEQYLKTNIIYF